MSNNAEELMSMVFENDNPEEALMIAINTILSFLEQPESSQ